MQKILCALSVQCSLFATKINRCSSYMQQSKIKNKLVSSSVIIHSDKMHMYIPLKNYNTYCSRFNFLCGTTFLTYAGVITSSCILFPSNFAAASFSDAVNEISDITCDIIVFKRRAPMFSILSLTSNASSACGKSKEKK